MLHTAYQNHHKEPGIVMGLRTVNDLIPRGERAFMMASDRLAMEELAVPPKLSNFVRKEGEDGR